MCRIQVLSTILCLGLFLVSAPGSVPGAQAAPASPEATIVLTPDWHFETNQAADISVLRPSRDWWSPRAAT